MASNNSAVQDALAKMRDGATQLVLFRKGGHYVFFVLKLEKTPRGVALCNLSGTLTK